MVAIVAGNGLGLLNTSLNILGGAGVLGQSVLGQGSSRAFVNAVSGNLVLQMQDEQLAGRGLDLYALRTYNSLGTPERRRWRWLALGLRADGAVPGTGHACAAASGCHGDPHRPATAMRRRTPGMRHGRRISAPKGSGAHDELRYDSVPGEWVWTDGSTRVTERYSNSTSSSMTGRLIRRTDTSDNSIVLMYDGGAADADPGYRQPAGAAAEVRPVQRADPAATPRDARAHRGCERACDRDARQRAAAGGVQLRQPGAADHRHDGSDAGRRQHCRRCRLRHELYLRRRPPRASPA